MARLRGEELDEVRDLFAMGFDYFELAVHFGVHPSEIARAIHPEFAAACEKYNEIVTSVNRDIRREKQKRLKERLEQ